jgi:hypothetical protein
VHVQEGGRPDAAEPSLRLEPVRRAEDGLVHAHDQQVPRPLLGRVGDLDGQLQGRDPVYGAGRPTRPRFHPARPRKTIRGAIQTGSGDPKGEGEAVCGVAAEQGRQPATQAGGRRIHHSSYAAQEPGGKGRQPATMARKNCRTAGQPCWSERARQLIHPGGQTREHRSRAATGPRLPGGLLRLRRAFWSCHHSQRS